MDVYEQVINNGYCLVESFDGRIDQLLAPFGEICMVTDVVVDLSTPALVTSDEALDFHTDHSRVKFIAWHCLKQSSEGGESRLIDARKVLESMPADLHEELTQIRLFEHKVFPGDPENCQLLRYEDNLPLVYYSFWLADDKQKQLQSFESFRNKISLIEEITIRLQSSDLLIIDNRRMLHGRNAIKGDKNRFLKRYWVN